jgi:hypothetical protein
MPDNKCEKYSCEDYASYCGFDDTSDCVWYKQSNADRIRAMSDEELAETITADWCSILCPGGSFFCDGECLNKMIEWLKQEAGT